MAISVGIVGGTVAVAPPSSAVTRETEISWAKSVFTLMNQERAANGRVAYRWNANLAKAAHAHNLKMAKYNALSHQISGESSFSARISATGYTWSSCAENIGYSTTLTLNGAYAVQRLMYNEVAPNDPHRRAILSTTYRDVGIDVVVDTVHRKLWITEDFARPR